MWLTVVVNTNRYHIDVLVPGRADGLIIKRHHFNSLDGAQQYQDDVAAHNLYVTDIAFCKDNGCRNFDITEGD